MAFLGITNTTTYEIPEASFRASAREPQSDAAYGLVVRCARTHLEVVRYLAGERGTPR